jgi:hypothetical protein
VRPLLERYTRALALGDVGRHDEPAPAARERQVVGEHVDVDDGAVLLAMTPFALARHRVRNRQLAFERLHVVARADVPDRHAQELRARVAVARDRRVVDGEERERLGVEHPHRLRVAIEEQPVALACHRIVGGGVLWSPLCRRHALVLWRYISAVAGRPVNGIVPGRRRAGVAPVQGERRITRTSPVGGWCGRPQCPTLRV